MRIFHDSLTGKFVRKYQTPKIRFVEYNPGEDLLNARFRCFNRHLVDHVYSKVLCLDVSDTEVYKDPFELIEPGKILMGSEMCTISQSNFVGKFFERAYGETYYPGRRLLNCGILGAEYPLMREILRLYVKELRQTKTQHCIDMAVWNTILYRGGYEISTGFPVHTCFAKNEPAETGAYIRHK